MIEGLIDMLWISSKGISLGNHGGNLVLLSS